jgi:hypothetical protein
MSDSEISMDDRRNALRQRSVVDTLLVEHAELGTCVCKVMDLSRKGMRLRMPVCIPCGSEILIYPPKGTDLRISKAEIVRQYIVRKDGNEYFECGVQFTESAELRRHTWFLSLRLADQAEAA